MDNHKMTEAFYGTIKIGKRGQVVIPVKAREDLGIEEGDRLFVVKHTTAKAIILIKIDALNDLE